MSEQTPSPVLRLADLPAEIVTPRTVINPLRPEDVPEYNAALRESWDDMHRWVTWARNPIEETMAAQRLTTEKRLAEFSLRQSFFMVARHPESREIMSFVTLYDVHDDARSMEAGYWTRKKYMGQGLTTEAMTGLLKWGFEKVGAYHLKAHHPEGHAASASTLHKLGFKCEGFGKNDMHMADGRVLREVTYSLDTADRLPALNILYR